MSEETAQDVQEETPSTESSPEESQPTEEPSASEGEKTQEPSEGEEQSGKTVPYSRFKQVNDQLKQLKDLKESLNVQDQPEPQMSLPQSGDVQADAEAKLQQIVGKAIQSQFGDVTKLMREQRAESQISEVRQKYPDFDDQLGNVSEVLKAMPQLRETDNPVETAYIMAKGLSASQLADEARRQGQQEAYNTIDKKIAGRPNSPTPKPSGKSESDVVKRFREGKLSEAQMKAHWQEIQAGLAS